MKVLLGIVFLALMSMSAQAHKPSDSYLAVNIVDKEVSVQWDIALRDLDYALGLDGNNDGQITWGELLDRQNALYAYVTPRLTLSSAQQPCPMQIQDLLIDSHSDGRYAVLKFLASCTVVPTNLQVAYQLFFDLDPQHRGLMTVMRAEQSESAIFSPTQAQREFIASQPQSIWAEFSRFALEGVWHIWIGYDHILFLLSLLLPAALVPLGKKWAVNTRFSATFWDVFRVVAAFTVAHSITLSLAVLGYVSLPARWVESAIAASVVLAALNNIYPLCANRRALLAFSFGLIHGLGIASVLLDMDLPAAQRLVSLLGFNLGVEFGQLAIVSVVLPIISLFSRYPLYPLVVLKAGSTGIMLVALVWLLERSLDMQLNMFG